MISPSCRKYHKHNIIVVNHLSVPITYSNHHYTECPFIGCQGGPFKPFISWLPSRSIYTVIVHSLIDMISPSCRKYHKHNIIVVNHLSVPITYSNHHYTECPFIGCQGGPFKPFISWLPTRHYLMDGEEWNCTLSKHSYPVSKSPLKH